jgi:secondary thiamine-phosphate synthase enzyme
MKKSTITISTHERNQLIDITNQIEKAVAQSGIEEGIVIVYTPHTTAGITINEGADPAVRADMNNFLRKLIPNLPEFTHLEGNSDSHIKSTLVGASETLLVEDGRLVLGRWQSIYFAEFDGPRSRKVFVKIVEG